MDCLRRRELTEGRLILDRCLIASEFLVGDLLIGTEPVELVALVLGDELLFGAATDGNAWIMPSPTEPAMLAALACSAPMLDPTCALAVLICDCVC